MSIPGLADVAKVTKEECREALRVLTSPDPDDTSKVAEGRRLMEIEGGWQVVNHERYRFATAARRELWRQNKAAQRAKKKRAIGGPVPGEMAHEAALRNGDTALAQRLDTHQPSRTEGFQ